MTAAHVACGIVKTIHEAVRQPQDGFRPLHIDVYGIVENMSGLECPKCGHLIPLFKIGGGEKAAKDLGVPFLGRIPIDPEVVQKSDSGTPYVVSYPDSEVTRAFNQVVSKIIAEA